jgi:hypothetical protein
MATFLQVQADYINAMKDADSLPSCACEIRAKARAKRRATARLTDMGHSLESIAIILDEALISYQIETMTPEEFAARAL